MYTSTMEVSYGKLLEKLGKDVRLEAREEAEKIKREAKSKRMDKGLTSQKAAAANVGGKFSWIWDEPEDPNLSPLLQMMKLNLSPYEIREYIRTNILQTVTVPANPYLNRAGTDYEGYGNGHYQEIKAFLDPFLDNQPPETDVGAFSYWNQILGAMVLTFGTLIMYIVAKHYLKKVEKFTRSFEQPNAFHVT